MNCILEDIVDFQNGFAFKSKDYSDDAVVRCEVLRMGYIARGGGFKEDDKPVYAPISSAGNKDRYQLQYGDLAMAMTDMKNNVAILGCVAFIKDDDRFLLNQRVGRLRVKDPSICDPRFLYFLLNSKQILNDLRSRANSGVQVNLTTAGIKETELVLPSISQQKAIAHILGTLDDKIELNRKMNETLEEIAKAIFKSWFVDFDPVRAKMEGRPTGLPNDIAALFPDRLVDSEIGEIPKGWSVPELSELADILMGQSPPGETYNDDGIGMPFYQGSTDFGFRYPSIRKYCSSPKREARVNDTLLSVRAPVGELNRAAEQCCIGRGVASVRSKDGLESWVYYLCGNLQAYFNTFNSEGTVFGSVSGKDLKAMKVVGPPTQVSECFENLASKIDQSIKLKTDEIDVLTDLRDTLLPKLISGELQIPDAETFLKEAGI